MRALALHCLLIGVGVFFLRGLCLVLGVLERLGLPFALKVTVGLMHALIVPLAAISVFIGLLDVWLDIQGRAKALRFSTEG
jgi:type III secretory pathway component EscU